MRAPSLLLLFILHQASLSICSDLTQTFYDPELSYAEYRPEWRVSDAQSVRLDFRTLLTDSMLVRHVILNSTAAPHDQYTMGLALRNGKLQAIHIFASHYEMITIGKGLHHDEWHSATLTKTAAGNFSVTLDGVTLWRQLNADSINGAARELAKTAEGVLDSVFVAGIGSSDGDNTGFPQQQFIGCIRNVQFATGGHNYTALPSISSVGTRPGCTDACATHDECKNGGNCVNQYSGTTCDCHATGYEGQKCETKGETSLTFYGFSFVEYTPYDANSKRQSARNKVSLQFKMGSQDQDTGILFYSVGTPPNPTYFSISLINGWVNASLGFGDTAYNLIGGSELNDDAWHTVSVDHHDRQITMNLDGAGQIVDITGENYHLYLDPTIYSGGGPNFAGNPGLLTGRNFVGCMKNTYVDTVNVFELLKKGDPRATHSGGEPSFGCNTIEITPLTFPTFTSQLILKSWRYPDDLKISFHFRTQQRNALVLMVGIHLGNDTRTYGSIRLLLDDGKMEVHQQLPSGSSGDTVEYWTYAGKDLHDAEWHTCALDVMLADGAITLQIDNEVFQIKSDRSYIRKHGGIRPATDIYLGAGLHNQERGFVGCMRDIVIQGKGVNPLDRVSSAESNGLILDGCDMQDLCADEVKCEHQSECIQDWYETYCDCGDTGYSGTVCHFPLAKQSCEDYYQMGFRHSGVRRIDPDGIGPLPPSYVHCEFLDNPIGYSGSQTVINHNLKTSTVVRKEGLRNIKKVLTYQEMESESLIYLVENSINCTQELTYECEKSPQYLGNQTSYLSAKGTKFDKEAGFTQNCDKNDYKERQDTAVVENPSYLPVTELFFLQERNKAGSTARMSLSPLACLGSKLYDPEYSVTFGNEGSYLMLDAWESGDLSFSFRTLQPDATLMFQEPSRHALDYLMVEIAGGSSVVFKFHTGGREANATIRGGKSLNNGNWHHVSVEYNQYHVRFTLDMMTSWFDLLEGEELGPFTGPLYIGGMDRVYATKIPGLEGCFRSLTIDGQVIALHEFIEISVNGSSPSDDVYVGCERSCDPDPCQNGAQCDEMWGDYICRCADVSHFGRNCEEDYLADVVAFPKPDAFLQTEAEGTAILEGDFRFHFRTRQPDSLLLYANDNLGNFIQVSFLKSSKLEFKFNALQTIVVYLMETDQEIVNGEWQQLSIVRTSVGTMLYLNGEKATIPVPSDLITEYIPEPRFINDVDNNIHPVISAPNENDTDVYTNIYLGGVDEAMINQYDSDTDGLEGCLRAFFVNGKPYKLHDLAAINEEVFDHCTPQCESDPCQNGGVCQEGWDSFTCDCQYTKGFKGSQCEIDVGAIFEDDAYILYKYNPINSSYIQPPMANDPTNDHLEFAFMANNVSYGVMAYVRGKFDSKEDEYIIVELRSDGHVYVSIDLGYGKNEFAGPAINERKYNDGQRHWFYFKRIEDNIILDVDNSQRLIEYLPEGSELSLFDGRDVIVVGGVEDVDKFGLPDTNKFTGCISEFQYNGIKPIDLAFGVDPNVVDVIGDVTQGGCSPYVPLPPVVVVPVLPTADLQTTRSPYEQMLTFPPWNVGEAETVYLEEEYPEIGAQASDSSVATVVVVIMVIVFVCLLLAIVITVYKMNKEDEKKKKEGYDKIPLKDVENGYGQPDEGVHLEDQPKPKDPSVPPPKPPHSYQPKDDDKVPLKDALEDSIIDSDDETPHHVPIQSPEEELEWDPAVDTTLVSDDPKLTPRPSLQPDEEDPNGTEDPKSPTDDTPQNHEPIQIVDQDTESESEPEAEHEIREESEPEPEEEPEPESDPVHLRDPEEDHEPGLEWDDELTAEEHLLPHERQVSFDGTPEDAEPETDEETEPDGEVVATETTPLHIEEGEDVPPSTKGNVKYTPLENEPETDDEVDHPVAPTMPEQEIQGAADREAEPEVKPEEEDEMVQAEIIEDLPPEHVSKKAELKTQEVVPGYDFVTNGVDQNHVNNKSDSSEDSMPGETNETPDEPEVVTTPQRKQTTTRTSRSGSSISDQSLEEEV